MRTGQSGNILKNKRSNSNFFS